MAPLLSSNILLSLFDRLTDDRPRLSVEVPMNDWERMAALKKSVARDLTNLLNTRISEHDIPEEFVEVRQSIVAYGVHDYTMSPVDKESVRRSIERCVRTFEPRLRGVQVQWLESQSSVLELHYRISATLKPDLGSEPVAFDAQLPMETRHFKVNTGR